MKTVLLTFLIILCSGCSMNKEVVNFNFHGSKCQKVVTENTTKITCIGENK